MRDPDEVLAFTKVALPEEEKREVCPTVPDPRLE
jgi:hypothetical protein